MIFDHIGLFVADLKVGREKLSAILPINDFTEEVDDHVLRVRIQFGTDSSGIRYELVAPFGDDNPVSGVLKSGKNVLNHVAYRVPDLEQAMAVMTAQDAIPLGSPLPAKAFGGRRVVFFYTSLKFIVELIEEVPSK